MKQIPYLLLCTYLVILSACQPAAPEQETDAKSSSDSLLAIAPPAQPCGRSLLIPLFSETGVSVGSLTCENDSARLWLQFEPSNGRSCQRSDIRFNIAGTEGWTDFEKLKANADGIYIGSVRMADWPAGACITFEGELLLQDAGGTFLKGRISSPERPNRIEYCQQSCERFSRVCAGLDLGRDFRAYTADAWLTGNGPASFPLTPARFQKAFPEGMAVGCATQQQLRDIAATRNWVNAAGSPERRQLAKELVALSYNLAFDAAEPAFAPGPDRLAELVLSGGDFEGWTTEAVLEELRTALGDCPSNYAFRQLNAAAAGINNNFSPEGQSQGFLRCPAD